MVSQITVGTSPVIRFGLGLYFVASVMAFDMTLNTNVCLIVHVAGSVARAEHICPPV